MANKLMQLIALYLMKDNYPSWGIEMKKLLIYRNVWKVVEKGFDKPSDCARVMSTERDQVDNLNGRHIVVDVKCVCMQDRNQRCN